MWRRILTLGALSMLVAGCGKSQDSQRLQLKMWLVGSQAQARTINELSKEFTTDTGVAVQCEAVSWDAAHSKYLTAVAGRVEPDIGTMGLTWGAEFGRLGALVDLAKTFPEDAAALEQETFPGLWSSIEQGGQLYGVPLDLSLQILYYRNDIIQQPPATWQELSALLQRLAKDQRRMIIDWGSLSWIGYSPFLWQAGGDYYDAEGLQATLDTPAAAAGLEFFRNLYTVYGIPKTSIPLEQGMRTGEFPLALSGNWKMISLAVGAPEIAGKWSVAVLPQGPTGRRTSFLGGRILSIFARSTHQREAWAFIKFLFRPDVQAKLYEEGVKTQDAYLPPNVATWERLSMDAGMKQVLMEQARDAKGPPAVPGWNETTHAIEAAIQRVVLHDAGAAEELRKADAAMQQGLETARAGQP